MNGIELDTCTTDDLKNVLVWGTAAGLEVVTQEEADKIEILNLIAKYEIRHKKVFK